MFEIGEIVLSNWNNAPTTVVSISSCQIRYHVRFDDGYIGFYHVDYLRRPTEHELKLIKAKNYV